MDWINVVEAPWVALASVMLVSAFLVAWLFLEARYSARHLWGPVCHTRRKPQRAQVDGRAWVAVPHGEAFHLCDPANGRIVGVISQAGRVITPLASRGVASFQVTIEGERREA